jgi:hypothetical protein
LSPQSLVQVGPGGPDVTVTVGLFLVASLVWSGNGGGMKVVVMPLQACVMAKGVCWMLDSATNVVGAVVTLTFQ